MSTTIKIKGGTMMEGESLCRTCRCAHIQRGFRESEETILCIFGGQLRRLPFKVAECTDYANRTVPYRYELERMALLINVDPVRKKAGFKSNAGFAAETNRDEETE